MAVTPVATSKGGAASPVSQATVVTPSTAQAGDLIVFGILSKTSTTGTYPNLPAGVTKLGAGRAATIGARLDVFAKTATGPSESLSMPFYAQDGVTTATAVHSWVCHAIRGADTTPEVLSTGAANTTQNVDTLASASPTSEANEYVVRFIGGSVASGTTDEKTPGAPVAGTFLASSQGTGTGTGLSWLLAYSETGPSPAGTVPAHSPYITLQNAPTTWATYAVGVKTSSAGAAPQNTTAPSIGNTANPGVAFDTEVLTLNDGAWTGTPTPTLSHVVLRDGVTVQTGGTTYTVGAADLGHDLVLRTAATNASGTVTADSAPIRAAAPMTTGALTIEGSAQNIGGGPTGAPPAALFPAVQPSESTAGLVDYAVVYARNGNTDLPLTAVVAWLHQQTPDADSDLAIAVATQGAGVDVPPLTDRFTAPSGVTWSAPLDRASGIALGTIPAGSTRGFYVRRTINANAAVPVSDTGALRFGGTAVGIA